MTNVVCYAGAQGRTHDISLTDGVDEFGLIFDEMGNLQEVPMSPPADTFQVTQNSWIGGRGRTQYEDDPTGYNDSLFAWGMTDGYVFPTPLFQYGAAYRVGTSKMLGASYTAFTLTRISAAVTAVTETLATSFNALGVSFWLRRVGNPGTLTMALKESTTTLKSATVTTSAISDTLPVFHTFDFALEALANTHTYTVVLTPAAGDDKSNHWELGYSGASVLYTFIDDTYFNDSRRKQHPYFFDFYGCKYFVYKNLLMINGDRGTATSGASATITQSTKSWTTNIWTNASVKIIEGAGTGQVRTISSNTSTALTVSVAWDKNPDSTSVYIIYNTPQWTLITGHGLTEVIAKPVEANKLCYFPQGLTYIRNMTVAHAFAADSTNTANYLAVRSHPSNGEEIIAVATSGGSVSVATAGGPSTNLTFGTAITVGSAGIPFTNIHNHNGTIYLFKENGPYTMDFNNKITFLQSGMSDAIGWNTGYAATSGQTTLYMSWNGSIEQLIGSTFLDMLNWKSDYEGLASNRRGNVTSIVTGFGWLFIAIDGGTSNYSSILAWNERGWCEIYRSQVLGRRIRDMAWQAQDTARPRLWMFDGNELVYIDFPLASSNPLKDSGLYFIPFWSFTTGTIDGGDLDLSKFIGYVKVMSDNLDNTYAHEITVEYQSNDDVGTTTWTRVGSIVDSPVQSLALELGNINQLRLRFSGYSNSISYPCKMLQWTLQGQKLQPLRYQYVGHFKFGSNQKTRTAGVDHKPQELIDWLLLKAQRMDKLTMRSVVKEMDLKTVTVSAPAIVNEYVRGQDRKGVLSLLIREAGL